MIELPYLFDVTRLISRSWTGRRATGLDRVSYAYLDQFGPRAHAVVQVKGASRILTRTDSRRLFSLLKGPDSAFRRQLARFTPSALMRGQARAACNGAIYLNVSQTEYDLRSHSHWVRACDLRAVYLIHDLIPILHPEFCRQNAVRRHRARVENALRTAAGIVLNSEATANDLARFAADEKLPEPPMRAIRIAGADLNAQGKAKAPPYPYFVCLGTIEPRKNHMLLMSIWRELAREMGDAVPRLMIIGQWGQGSDDVRRGIERDPALARCVTVLDHCSDAELARWMKGARALLMPTRAEGFGLPLVEALAIGTPVLASDLPVFRELGHGIPELIDPEDRIRWRRLILAYACNGSERQAQIAALSAYRAPRWDKHFETLEPWLEALPRRGQATGAAHSPLAERPCDVATGDDTAPENLAVPTEASASTSRLPSMNEIELNRA